MLSVVAKGHCNHVFRYMEIENIKDNVCVCLSLLYRNPNRWTDLDEIWYRGGPQGRRVRPSTPTPHPLRTGSGVPLEPQPCILVNTL